MIACPDADARLERGFSAVGAADQGGRRLRGASTRHGAHRTQAAVVGDTLALHVAGM